MENYTSGGLLCALASLRYAIFPASTQPEFNFEVFLKGFFKRGGTDGVEEYKSGRSKGQY